MTIATRSSHPALSLADNVAMSTSDFLILCGRILLAWIFMRSGFYKVFDIPGYAASFPGRGLPVWSAYIAAPFEFFGGLALILGLATRYLVLAFIFFTLVASFSTHAYWTFADATQRRINDISFWKNISIIGGFVLLFVTGPGKWSLDRWLAGRR